MPAFFQILPRRDVFMGASLNRRIQVCQWEKRGEKGESGKVKAGALIHLGIGDRFSAGFLIPRVKLLLKFYRSDTLHPESCMLRSLFFLPVLTLFECQGNGIDAVPQTRRFRTVLEDVAQVSPAPRAVYFRSAHEELPVILCRDVLGRDGPTEAGPSCT